MRQELYGQPAKRATFWSDLPIRRGSWRIRAYHSVNLVDHPISGLGRAWHLDKSFASAAHGSQMAKLERSLKGANSLRRRFLEVKWGAAEWPQKLMGKPGSDGLAPSEPARFRTCVQVVLRPVLDQTCCGRTAPHPAVRCDPVVTWENFGPVVRQLCPLRGRYP